MEQKAEEVYFSDLQRARELLRESGASVVLCKGENYVTKSQRGIRPLLEWEESGEDYGGWSAADKIVGRAAAFLFILLGVRAVYGEVMSEGAFRILSERGIAAEYGTLAQTIRNREGTGMCPMEQAVLAVTEPTDAPQVLRRALQHLRQKQEAGGQ